MERSGTAGDFARRRILGRRARAAARGNGDGEVDSQPPPLIPAARTTWTARRSKWCSWIYTGAAHTTATSAASSRYPSVMACVGETEMGRGARGAVASGDGEQRVLGPVQVEAVRRGPGRRAGAAQARPWCGGSELQVATGRRRKQNCNLVPGKNLPSRTGPPGIATRSFLCFKLTPAAFPPFKRDTRAFL